MEPGNKKQKAKSLRIYLDTCVWCRPFDEYSPKVKREAEAFFEILRGVGEGKFDIIGSIIFHLAAAVEGKAECFITVDDDILTRASKIKQCGIEVLNPTNLVEV